MNRISSIVATLLAATAPAIAQPSPTPDPAPAPAPSDPAQSPSGESPPPPGGTTTTTEAQPPAPPPVPPEPPPPPPPRFVGLVPSSASDQRMYAHSHALDKETEVPDHPFTAFVFADYWFLNGPRVGGTLGIFRAFEFHLGALLDTKTTMGATMTDPSTTSSETRIFYGASVGLLSFAGVSVAGGLTILTGQGDTSSMLINGTLSVPLYAHWLPFRVPNTRLRVTYPAGVGLEWGVL